MSMKKLAAFIVKHKALLVGVVGILAVLSIVALLNVTVNSDILSYLPDGVDRKSTRLNSSH